MNDKTNATSAKQTISYFLEDVQPKVIGLTALAPTYYSLCETLEVITDYYDNNNLSRPWVVVGGPLVSVVDVYGDGSKQHSAISVLQDNPAIDVCVVGEGEVTFAQLVDALILGRDYTSVTGIACRDGERIVINPRQLVTGKDGLIRHLDRIPALSAKKRESLYDADTFEDYYNLGVFDGRKSTTIFSSRGCPYSCSFCSSRLIWGSTRYHSAERVLREIVDLNQAGYEGIFFEDDTTTLNRRRMMSLSKAIQEAKSRGILSESLTFGCGTRVEVFDDDLMSAMFDAGFRFVYFGLETASEHIRENIGKLRRHEAPNEYYSNAIEKAKKVGYTVELSLQFGLPGETIATADFTIDWVKKVKPSEITVNFSTLYPGSALTHQFARGRWPQSRKVVVTGDYRQVNTCNSNELLRHCVHGIHGILSPIVTDELIEHVIERVVSELSDYYQPGACYRR